MLFHLLIKTLSTCVLNSVILKCVCVFLDPRFPDAAGAAAGALRSKSGPSPNAPGNQKVARSFCCDDIVPVVYGCAYRMSGMRQLGCGRVRDFFPFEIDLKK